jgi:hypothetical protein
LIGSLHPHEDGRAAPDFLEPVVPPLLWREDVRHDIAVIEQNPARSCVSLEPRAAALQGAQRKQGLYQRLHLAFARGAGNDEEIGKGRDLLDVQKYYVLAEVIRDNIQNLVCQGSGFQFLHLQGLLSTWLHVPCRAVLLFPAARTFGLRTLSDSTSAWVKKGQLRAKPAAGQHISAARAKACETG